jgi:hypothetical protein
VVTVSASPCDKGISLTVISPSTKTNTDAPKGYAPYQPYAKTKLLAARIMECYQLLRDQDALPAGPRTIGYRLKETYRGQYAKAGFPNIDRVIKRLNQAGTLPFEWVADGSGGTHEADGWDGPVEFLRDAHILFDRDRRDGQPVVAEVACEARGTLGLILRLRSRSRGDRLLGQRIVRPRLCPAGGFPRADPGRGARPGHADPRARGLRPGRDQEHHASAYRAHGGVPVRDSAQRCGAQP